VEKPPLLRPKASSSGFRSPFFVRRARPAPGARGVLVGPNHRVVHAHLPLHLSDRVVLVWA
jgi:hypothetical protein